MADQHHSGRNETMTMTPSRDDVARRAYELFEARGAEPGHDIENWLDAERELSTTTTSEVHEPSRESRRDRER
jgi:Protein of unknown function (DUF2934)